MNLRPAKDYYVIKLIETEKKPGSLLLVDEERLPIRQARILAVPLHQEPEDERVVGELVLVQKHYAIDIGAPEMLIKKDYILAEVRD